MFLLILSNAAELTAPPRPQVQATATVRIERPAIASGKAWDRSPKQSRREIVIHDERGAAVRVRVIEFE